MVVTAAHVYAEYVRVKQRAPRTRCFIENVEFDPERRLIGMRDGIDIATFDFSYEELSRIRKQPIRADFPIGPRHTRSRDTEHTWLDFLRYLDCGSDRDP